MIEIIEIKELDTYDFIAGSVFGRAARESNQWKLYKTIKEKYSSEMIENEYYKTNSIISKVYLYWILHERKWGNNLLIYDDLMNYKGIKLRFAPYGCIVSTKELEVIVNYDYQKM
jgi:hypothetical protein